MQENIQSIALGQQLAAAAGMMLAMTVTHAVGLTAATRVLGLRSERLKELDFGMHSLALMCGSVLFLLLLHTLEVAAFAGFYLAIGAMQTVEEALYYSASAYTTLGRTAEYFPDSWRLMSAIEALIGFLLISWSTAFIVSKANRLMPE